MTATAHYPTCCEKDNGDALGINPTATSRFQPMARQY
jgi:hypothetical protein